MQAVFSIFFGYHLSLLGFPAFPACEISLHKILQHPLTGNNYIN